jgi:hypothetical protein
MVLASSFRYTPYNSKEEASIPCSYRLQVVQKFLASSSLLFLLIHTCSHESLDVPRANGCFETSHRGGRRNKEPRPHLGRSENRAKGLPPIASVSMFAFSMW